MHRGGSGPADGSPAVAVLWPVLAGLAAAVGIWWACRQGIERPDAARGSMVPKDGFLPTQPAAAQPPESSAPPGMVWIPGGEFSMGCADPRGRPHGGPDPMRDARPVHRVRLDGFWIDRTEVTNARFAEFVTATGYVTVAERTPRAEDFPGAPPENLVPGALVFTPPEGLVSLSDHYSWWNYVPGASWRHPTGPGSGIAGRDTDPVVQIAHEDAAAFAAWAGGRLPTEAEWEFAARGGLHGALYPWGDEFRPGGRAMANTWQGGFPNENTAADGFVGPAPVASFPANAFGLHDTSGNVWEWCADWYRPDTYATAAGGGGVAVNPTGPAESYDPLEPGQAKRVLRGGSFLCSESYCARYIVGTRGKGEISSGCNHIGFRCARSAGGAISTDAGSR
jgi:formylglycine-generating enzyme required for sulfatase activity